VKCPIGISFASKANNPNSAHVALECANQGFCDRSKVFIFFCMVTYFSKVEILTFRVYANASWDLKEMLVKNVIIF
jgi:hypothetical protein